MSKTTWGLNRRDFIKGTAKAAAGVVAGLAAVKGARAEVYKSILPSSV
ncbi:MAG: twin-arginine translocation signal domain-containing protein, partial [Candidatus Hydrogenedentes bacterium]|nr:twin-arginine translocation signal domain-containing protein [Candidatus Hydrogenedentota bacterium]